MSLVERYANGGHRRVHGFVEPVAIPLIRAMDAVQKRDNTRGSIVEIGVHNGRLFILLFLLRRAGEVGVALDLFDMQDLNLDKSGEGDEEIFRRNLRTHAQDVSGLVVLKGDSTTFTPADITKAAQGPVRLFSVDGGHTAHITKCDLITAAGAITQHGIVILDDYFNEEWPGVSEGASDYLRAPDCPLVPVAIGGNKVILTTRGSADAYLAHLRTLDFGVWTKDDVMFGSPIIAYSDMKLSPLKRFLLSDRWQNYRNTPMGIAFRKTVRRLRYR